MKLYKVTDIVWNLEAGYTAGDMGLPDTAYAYADETGVTDALEDTFGATVASLDIEEATGPLAFG